MHITKINERSWGIDLISQINEYLLNKDVLIKRAGGEKGLKVDKKTLFPDLLLFGDIQSAKILQGWELKMPDTDIDDSEFVDNAYKKAQALGLNSFLLWNVKVAKLYKITDATKNVIKVWEIAESINTREDVENHRQCWVNMLHQILTDLNAYFNSGTISFTTIIKSLSSDNILKLILSNKQVLSQEYSNQVARNSAFEDEVNLWWDIAKSEYPERAKKLDILAEMNLFSWANKFIFANLIKRNFRSADAINNIDSNTTPNQAVSIIEEISHNCDFWNIFKGQIGDSYLPQIIWDDFISLNNFLIDSQIQDIKQESWQSLFENIISEKHRKIYGQFPTPKNLAKLLVALTVENKELNVLDPCCGTGTIVKELYNLKASYGINQDLILDTIWASDKIAFPLQLTTMSLFSPNDMGKVLNVFQEDVVNLEIGENIIFADPYTGENIEKALPKFNYIASNLPFVRGEDVSRYSQNITVINSSISELMTDDYSLGGRSDLAFYIPFKLWSILEDDGKIGIIISNSWLATDAGVTFQKILRRFFFIENVVTSGNGRWFKNAKIITNILVLKKKQESEINNCNANETICFTTLKQNLESLNVEENITVIRRNVANDNELVRKVIYNTTQLSQLEELGLQWSALFTDLNWIQEISAKLIKASALFDINRGERRGWDPLFYPTEPNNIEQIFLKPVLKTASSVSQLEARPDGVAFCCNLSLNELQNDYNGAYSWVNHFATQVNGVGRLLPEVLARTNSQWYQMNNSTTANFVTSMNPDERLFIAKFDEPTFVNQRLIRFTRLEAIQDSTLLHALLNSVLGMFYLESLGFGRGEGVLDLSAAKLKKSLWILNPNLLNTTQKESIINSFQPLLNRNIKPLIEELSSQDRENFDDTVLEAFGILQFKENIKTSLLNLYNIRKSALS